MKDAKKRDAVLMAKIRREHDGLVEQVDGLEHLRSTLGAPSEHRLSTL